MMSEQCRGLSAFDVNSGRRATLKPRTAFDVDVSNGDERHAPRTHAAASRGTKGPCDSCAMWAHRGATSGYTVDRNAHGGVRDRASVSLLFVLSSRVPATFLRDSSLRDGHRRWPVASVIRASWKRGDDGEHAGICTEDGVSSILISSIASRWCTMFG